MGGLVDTTQETLPQHFPPPSPPSLQADSSNIQGENWLLLLDYLLLKLIH